MEFTDLKRFLSKKGNNLDNKESITRSSSSFQVENALGAPKTDFLIENIVFKLEKGLIDQNNCEVCGVDFSFDRLSKMFCFICGKGVCWACSNRKINGNRVCDLCLLRARCRDVVLLKGFLKVYKDFKGFIRIFRGLLGF